MKRHFPGWADAEPACLLAKPVVVATRLYHDGCAPLVQKNMLAIHSRTQATCPSIRPVFSGLKISLLRYISHMACFWNRDARLDMMTYFFLTLKYSMAPSTWKSKISQ